MSREVNEAHRAGMRITTTVDGARELVALDEDRYLPKRYSVTADKPGLPLVHLSVVVEYERPTCTEVRLERRSGGPPITATVLREVPLARIVRESVAVAGRVRFHPIPADDPSWDDVPELEYGSKELADEIQTSLVQAYDARQGAPVTDDVLRQVADIYRRAHTAGKPPTQAVKQELGVSRSTAGRYVQRAREKGFLGRTRQRVAGEQP